MSRRPVSAYDKKRHRSYLYWSDKELRMLEVTPREMSALVRKLVKEELKRRQAKKKG